ncbi:MAG TPA: preprotein translocase subunit SecA [Gemmataceae bacterium]|nr:preprotein translocase subunit SecA [Gemmataceae bacterium]
MANAVSVETNQPPIELAEAVRENQTNRFGFRWVNYIKALLGTPSQRRLAQAALKINPVRHLEKEFSKLSDAELKQTGLRLKGRARGGESLNKILPEAFGLVCVAAQRALKLRPFDVQLAAGVILHKGAFAEVATGEGKTLVAALPIYLNALSGQGVHLTTVNDYLARRDAEWIGPIYEMLGLSVGVLQMQMEDAERTKAYRCDITYGMASEFGFDFLRDRLKLSSSKGQATPFWAPWGHGRFQQTLDPRIQREHYFALVDEGDNIFIDEARTPLIISSPSRPATPEEQVVYTWANNLAKDMVREKHFTIDEKKQKVELTEECKQILRWSNPPVGPHSHAMDKLHEHVERSVHANHRFRRDQHYMVEKEKVVIIDEFTGRRMPDRHWREGLHQAVEAKEGVQITLASDHAAQITFQSYFRLYKKLAGMSGTAAQNFWELRRVYKLWVVCVPTNMPVIRKQFPDQVFPTEDTKFDKIVDDILQLKAKGRPVLIGTRSVEKSEILSGKLKKAGVDHDVLNARFHEMEAQIVAQAGQPGRVTIATNMAGRGTDIKLGPGVAEKGGLHVFGTERHEARRIDRQLAGRAGRQGDPGSAQFLISLDDELLEALGPHKQDTLRDIGKSGGNANWNKYFARFMKAQKKMERRHYRQRVDLLAYEKQRQEVLKDIGADPYVD